MKKSQVSTEFVFFVGAAFVLFAVYLLISYNYLNLTLKRKDVISSVGLLEELRNEINLASRVDNGYNRIITLPPKINKRDYNISFNGRDLAIKFSNIDYARSLSTVVKVDKNGSGLYFSPGSKIFMTKINNEVYIDRTCSGSEEVCSNTYPYCGNFSIGPKNGNGFNNNDLNPGDAWSNPKNAQISDDAYASVTRLDTFSDETKNLKTTVFKFNIPNNVKINGIKVDIEKSALVNNIKDDSVAILKNNVTSALSQHKNLTFWSTTDTYTTYGNQNDLWGLTWTPADINNDGFGVSISANIPQIGAGETARIDHIRITVYYSFNGCTLKCQNSIFVFKQYCAANNGCNVNRLSCI